MNDAQVLEETQSRQELDGEAADQAVLEALVVIHLDEFVEVDGVQVEHNAEMVAPDEVILKFDDALYLVRIVLLKKKEQLGLDRCLIVVLLLILHHLDGDHLFRFVILALENLTERTFPNQLN